MSDNMLVDTMKICREHSGIGAFIRMVADMPDECQREEALSKLAVIAAELMN